MLIFIMAVLVCTSTSNEGNVIPMFQILATKCCSWDLIFAILIGIRCNHKLVLNCASLMAKYTEHF